MPFLIFIFSWLLCVCVCVCVCVFASGTERQGEKDTEMEKAGLKNDLGNF